MSEKVLLTITMLVSDREDTIEKCMKSLVHLREAVPSELIVVDTAENKVCMDIVKQYTDNIVRFEWCNDFAAARNAGAKKAKGEWLMFLDDDEWFETTEEIEDFFLSGKYKKYNGASYIVRNYHNTEGTSWSDFEALRLARRTKDTKFIGKIHEFLTPMEPPFYYMKDYAHHYGYVFASTQERNEHSWRNIRLLLDMRKENPQNIHVMGQLIQEHTAVGEIFSAIELCKEILSSPKCWTDASNARYATYAAMTEAMLYARQHRYEDEYQFAKELLEKPEITVLARGVLNNFIITCCYHMEKYEEALEYIEKYRESCAAWKDYPDKKLMDAFSACAKYMEESEQKRFTLLQVHMLVLCERWQEAGEDVLAVDWESREQKILQETPKDVVDILKNLPYDPRYMDAVRSLLRSVNYSRDMYKAYDASTLEERQRLMEYFSLIPPKDSRICLYHLIYAGEKNDLGLAVPALEKMRECSFPFFLPDKEYWDSLRKLNIQVNSYMDSLSAYEWMELARRLWAEMALETCESAYLCLIRGLEKTELRFLFLSALMMEKRLLSEPAPQEDKASGQEEAAADLQTVAEKDVIEELDTGTEVQWASPDDGDTEPEQTDDAEEPRFTWQLLTVEELWDRLSQISQYWVSCAASLYREDVFMGDLIEAIPPAYRFGWYIMQANAVKNENNSLFLHKVADAAKAYPMMKELCKYVIQVNR